MESVNVTSILLYIIVLHNTIKVKSELFNVRALHSSHLDNLIFNDQYFLKLFEPVSKIRCTQACAETVGCVSFFYNYDQKKCRLHSTGFYNATDGTAESNWIYFVFGETWCPVHDGFVHERVFGLCIHFKDLSFYGYDNATAFCQAKQASTITLSTAVKVNQFNEIIGKINASHLKQNSPGGNKNDFNAYIGLRNTAGTWKWDNGPDLGTEARWGPHQPLCTGLCECGAIAKGPDPWNWLWKDVKCDRKFPVVCKYT